MTHARRRDRTGRAASFSFALRAGGDKSNTGPRAGGDKSNTSHGRVATSRTEPFPCETTASADLRIHSAHRFIPTELLPRLKQGMSELLSRLERTTTELLPRLKQGMSEMSPQPEQAPPETSPRLQPTAPGSSPAPSPAHSPALVTRDPQIPSRSRPNTPRRRGRAPCAGAPHARSPSRCTSRAGRDRPCRRRPSNG